jgi:predicted acylesterase/phospholipase RssA
MTREPRIGLALSGGGFRAAAFGLGALRALHDLDLLNRVEVISGISGGALMSAMWAYGPSDFGEFDSNAVKLMRSGIQFKIARKQLAPRHAANDLLSLGRSSFPVTRRHISRTTTRTDALRHVLEVRLFGSTSVDSPTRHGVTAVVSATDLRTTNAVRFSNAGSSCSAYGQIVDRVTVAEAVSASAAFPLLLPALERTYTFSRRDGSQSAEKVCMTDGGVYDNLGLSVLMPGRSNLFTRHAYDLDYIVSVDAGRGRPGDSAARFLPARLSRSFDITYRKTQDGGRALLNSAAASGTLKGFVHAYLGMPDGRMPTPLADLVPATQVTSYPTNFQGMDELSLGALTLRGEQLVRNLIDHYCRELVS